MRKPPEGLLLREIGAEIGMSMRAMHAWLKAGVIPSAPFRGTATRYGPEVLEQARKVRKLRDEGLNFEKIRRHLAMEQERARAAAEKAAAEPAAMGAASGGDLWQRIVLVPGLELHVREGGGALIARLASEIRANYGTAGGA